MRYLEGFAFAVAVGIFIFLGGIVVGKYQYWPYDVLNQARDATRALWVSHFPQEKPEFASPHTKGGVTRYDPEAAQDGVTFLALRRPEGFGALLIGMDGTELHRWRLNFSDVFPGDAPHLLSRASDAQINWHGVHLYPDGDVLLNFEGGNFPFGGGLVRIDKESRLKWALARNTHHDIDVQPDGTIVVLAHEYLPDGEPACAAFFKPPYLADRVLTVSDDGRELDSFSLAEAFCRSPYRWMTMPFGTYSQRRVAADEIEDLQHSNNVQVVRPEEAAVFPMARAGDYLVSFRNMNMVAVVDARTKLVKWGLVGNFVRQHDPDILPNGNLLIYDNLGGMADGRRPQGRSRVIEINPSTHEIVWKYEGGVAPHDQFESSKGGNVQLLPNGNVLISHSWQGRAFEVTHEPEPRIVWEYVNLLRSNETGGVTGSLASARRFAPTELSFLPVPAF
jgi:hypothetical protein